ncbi:MAG TPA: ABC transporter ATP-binding protein [Desulfobacteraceae bacterium]|nr:ABC transporter ATP-binding protein [Desulfobacteraceae bacterium]
MRQNPQSTSGQGPAGDLPRGGVLELENLSCGYSSTTVLRNISFSAFPGETVTILGTNGCGKTTLLKTIATSLAPVSGRVLLEGADMGTIPRQQRALKVAVVMQAVEAPPMTVEEYVMLGRLPHFKPFQFFESSKDRRVVHNFLELTGTFKLRDMLFNRISGGEKQLVSIARALVQEPSLLLLDEPTSHLDIFHQAEILKLVTRIRQELKIAVVMVLHDLNLACEYADRVVLINGKTKGIYLTGNPVDVITPEAVNHVYSTEVVVRENPVSGKPCIFLVNREGLEHNSGHGTEGATNQDLLPKL